MPKVLAARIVAEILGELSSRKGLSQAWDEIDEDIRDEIIATLISRVSKVLEQ